MNAATGAPLRVLITAPNLATAGGKLVIRDLVSRFDPTVIRPSICVHHRTGAALEKELTPLLDDFFELPMREPTRPLLTLPRRVHRLAAALRGRFDLVHSFDYASTWPEAAAARLAGIPLVIQKMNMTWGTRRWTLHGLLATHIVCLSETQQHELFARTMFARRTTVIHLGVDLNAFSPHADQRAAIRAELGLSGDAVAVACVSNIMNGKGHADLIEAFTQVAQTRPGAILGFIGDGDDGLIAELRATAVARGIGDRVRFFGRRQDVPRLLPAFDGFALASHRESFGVALVEAMACGLPVIATRCGGPEDIVVPGQTGWLVGTRDIDALASALTELLDDPTRRSEYGRAGRRRAEQEFSRDVMTSRYQQLYREIAAAASP